MPSTVTNQSSRIVSFRGNSGETWHLAPHGSVTIVTTEISENEKIRKLENLGFITVHHSAPVVPAAPTPHKPDKPKKTRKQQHKH